MSNFLRHVFLSITHFAYEYCSHVVLTIFIFVQACQGDQLDNGVRLVSKTETDGASMSYKIPTHADFLIVYR